MSDSRHFALVANQATTITLNADYRQIEVVSRDGAAEVYFTVNGPVPTIGGDGTSVLPEAISSVDMDVVGNGHTTVRLISPGAPKISVRAW